MFENLTERLTRTFKNLRGQGRLTEDNIQHALREVRLSLIEADVALPVIKEFIEQVKQKSLGQEVLTSLNPIRHSLKSCMMNSFTSWAMSGLNLITKPNRLLSF